MGQIIGIISGVLILASIYLRIGGNNNKLSNMLFAIGIIGMVIFVAIFTLAIFD
ncbi:MAG TPA: hypothetical protein P5232_04235 [Candidatus Moranbacteria bacterium]|nr:hypothetical protein [Candidatus Moranbacteria bacterium]